jgi:hypothetical protein
MATVWAWCPPQPAYREQPAWLIRLTGPDSRRFLHGQTSATIELVAPGRWVSSCCIGPTARLLGLAEVLIDTEGAWLAITEGDGQRVRQALDRVLFPGERVELGQPEPARWLTPVPGGAEEAAAGADGEAEEGWVALADGQGWQLGRGPLGQALLLRPEAPLPSAWYQRQPPNGSAWPRAATWARRPWRGWPPTTASNNSCAAGSGGRSQGSPRRNGTTAWS